MKIKSQQVIFKSLDDTMRHLGTDPCRDVPDAMKNQMLNRIAPIAMHAAPVVRSAFIHDFGEKWRFTVDSNTDD